MLDEVKVPRFLRNAVAPVVAAAGLMGGSPKAGAAMPMAPSMGEHEGFSNVPFNRNIGPRPEVRHITDYDLYWHQVKMVKEFLEKKNSYERMGRHIETPMWYLKMGDYYKWKRPTAPEFSEREQAYAKYMNDPRNSEEQKTSMTKLYRDTK